MAANTQMKFSERFRESLEQAQARLTNLEEDAQKMLQDVVSRSKASRKEVANILSKINASAGDIFDKETVKEWQGKARNVSADFAHRLEDLRARAIAFAGVATSQQVDDLAKDLDKLSRKIDRFLGTKKNSGRADAANKESKQ